MTRTPGAKTRPTAHQQGRGRLRTLRWPSRSARWPPVETAEKAYGPLHPGLHEDSRRPALLSFVRVECTGLGSCHCCSVLARPLVFLEPHVQTSAVVQVSLESPRVDRRDHLRASRTTPPGVGLVDHPSSWTVAYATPSPKPCIWRETPGRTGAPEPLGLCWPYNLNFVGLNVVEPPPHLR